MLQAEEPALSRSEWIVLSLVCEGPTHGNAVSHLVGPEGGLGQIWRVQRGVVYRCLDRLSDLGLIRSAGEEPSPQGPARLLVEATEAGQAAAVAWQHRPVQHTRDIRSELLVKLALLHRSGADPHDRLAAATGFDRTLLLWRYETASATVGFLDALVLTPPQLPART